MSEPMTGNRMPAKLKSRRTFLLGGLLCASPLIMTACESVPGGDGGFSIDGPLNDDADLSERVRARLRQRGILPINRIQVSTRENNRIRLAGFALSSSAKNSAEDAALSVEGVTGVINAITVQ